MGYYSDVRFNTTREGYERFKEMLGDARELFFDSNGFPGVFDADEDGVIFGWDCTKWYSEFPEVRKIMNVYHALRDDGVPFEYVRIGEELGDYDYDEDDHRNWWEPPRLKRHIEPLMTINVW